MNLRVIYSWKKICQVLSLFLICVFQNGRRCKLWCDWTLIISCCWCCCCQFPFFISDSHTQAAGLQGHQGRGSESCSRSHPPPFSCCCPPPPLLPLLSAANECGLLLPPLPYPHCHRPELWQFNLFSIFGHELWMNPATCESHWWSSSGLYKGCCLRLSKDLEGLWLGEEKNHEK